MIQALESPQPVPKVIVSSRARQEPCRRGVSLCFSVGPRLVHRPEEAGVWFSHLTGACIPGRGQGPEPGGPGRIMCWCLSVHTVFGMGFNLAWFSSPSFPPRSMCLRTCLCSKARPQSVTTVKGCCWEQANIWEPWP